MADSFEGLDPEVQEYIDQLHDRVQFLEEELKESEKTVLELRQEQGRTPSNSGDYSREEIRRHGKDLEELKEKVDRLDIDGDEPGTKLLGGGSSEERDVDPDQLKENSKDLRDKVDEEYDFEF
jgi:chromosome segregation ATPase